LATCWQLLRLINRYVGELSLDAIGARNGKRRAPISRNINVDDAFSSARCHLKDLVKSKAFAFLNTFAMALDHNVCVLEKPVKLIVICLVFWPRISEISRPTIPGIACKTAVWATDFTGSGTLG